MAGYTEEIVATITLPEDDEQAKTLLRSLEGLVIRGLRAAHPSIQLKNRNSPRSENVRSRERMRAWRLRNGQGQVDPDTGLSTSYMAVRGRIYRQRRKDRQAAQGHWPDSWTWLQTSRGSVPVRMQALNLVRKRFGLGLCPRQIQRDPGHRRPIQLPAEPRPDLLPSGDCP
jgi:hypothetical protein